MAQIKTYSVYNHASRAYMHITATSKKHVKIYLREKGWEQDQLAQIAGITTANIRSVEAGKYAVNIDVLNKIAGALGAELRMVEKRV